MCFEAVWDVLDVLHNEPLFTVESLHGSPSPLSVVLDKFVTLGRGRSAWVTTDRQRLQGLVAARPRAERSAWEIDYLIEGSDADALPSLIDRAIADGLAF